MWNILARSSVFGAAVACAGMLAAPAAAAPLRTQALGSAAAAAFAPLTGSFIPSNDPATGPYVRSQMSIEVVLAPGNGSELAGLLADRYDPNGTTYAHWLTRGQFAALFAPPRTEIAAVSNYLQASGLAVVPSASPFLVRAVGSSAAISAAFGTSLQTFRSARGGSYFANASTVELPTGLAAGVVGVVGLSDKIRLHSNVRHQVNAAPPASTNCQAPYPTRAQLYAFVTTGTPFPVGYGGGPGCNGLTPAQDNAIYGAPDIGSRGKGAGVNLGLFELSAYQRSDVAKWARTFYGSGFRAPLVDIIVDGGPLHPICPSHDSCPSSENGYSGDVEVDADIEMQLAIAPAVSHILVYNAPNDSTGQTSLDEYARIANDDLADSVSTSWGLCENEAGGAAYVRAENIFFEQMALQGQSMFAAAGDSGAFDCLPDSSIVNVDDPGAQPWVTSVGGTSFESYNPGSNAKAVYPAGDETVWNADELCNTTRNEGGKNYPGLFWCVETGAGGGGNSQFWGRPFYQAGPGIINPYTAYANGTTHCWFAAVGRACREVPDVSANADPFTGYAEYCTSNAGTPYSECATFSSTNAPGWFAIGGTSLSSPLWAALIADRDGFRGSRTGSANQLLYLLYDLDPRGYFNDITGAGQRTDTNGLFPTVAGYDLATGIGTPKMSAIITGVPQR